MSVPTAADLLAQIKAFTSQQGDSPSSLDGTIRKELHEASRRLALLLEDPGLAAVRRTIGQPAEKSAFKIALDLNLLPILARDDGPKSLVSLSEASGADSRLLMRVLRILAAHGVVNERDGNTYVLSPSCVLLGDERIAKAVNFCQGLTDPLFDALSNLIRDGGYREPTDRLNGAAQRAYNSPGKELFAILNDQGPEVVEGFSTFLNAVSKGSAKVHEVYPIEERLVQGFDRNIEEHMWVDVGGGLGQFTIDLKETFPNMPGKLLVEDQQSVVAIAKAKGLDNLTDFLAHDFFTEQPIKGARAYYLREVFHNWQDEYCKKIFVQLGNAMRPGYSRLLIHDVVMAETGAGVWETTMDWMMMAGYSTLERTMHQWEQLIEGSGLRINRVYSHATSPESLIEVLKD